MESLGNLANENAAWWKSARPMCEILESDNPCEDMKPHSHHSHSHKKTQWGRAFLEFTTFPFYAKT